MLEEVLRYINNRFERSRVEGEFSISGGGIELPALVGQCFWIEGSVLNDGLHVYPASDLQDEDFTGSVVLLAVPNALVDLADEISGWCAENASALNSPYQSESFGGYSYTKAAGGEGLPSASWQAHFAARLRPYRKLSRDWR